MDFSPLAEAEHPEFKPWEHNAICTPPKDVAEKRSNNKLKSWPNIRCRVRAKSVEWLWKNSEAEELEGGRGGLLDGGRKEIMHGRSQWAFENPRSARKCLLSYEIALKWYIPEGKESHFVCITLKRSQGDQTGMRELVNHQETWGGGVWREDQREKRQSAPFRCSDILITPGVPGDTVYGARLRARVDLHVHSHEHVQYLSVPREEEHRNGIWWTEQGCIFVFMPYMCSLLFSFYIFYHRTKTTGAQIDQMSLMLVGEKTRI